MNQMQIQELAQLAIGFLTETLSTRATREEVQRTIVLRDTFAAAALMALVTCVDGDEKCAAYAYNLADAMLVERSRRLHDEASRATASAQSETRDTEPPVS